MWMGIFICFFFLIEVQSSVNLWFFKLFLLRAHFRSNKNIILDNKKKKKKKKKE